MLAFGQDSILCHKIKIAAGDQDQQVADQKLYTLLHRHTYVI